MENKRAQIKIGDLYLESIYVDSDYPNTKFIREIDLESDGRTSYDKNDAFKIIDILSDIGITAVIQECED